MRRVVVGVLVFLLALSGCSQALGTADWDRIDVAYTSPEGATELPTGDYTLVVTPTQLSYALNKEKPKTQKLPDGAWAALTTGVRAFGDRKPATCAGKGSIRITASAAGTAKQDFAANGCDAGDAFKQATDLFAQLLAQIK
jgi:hypothetical protein